MSLFQYLTNNVRTPALWDPKLHTSKAFRYGTRSQRISLHTPRSSANGMNHTCLCLPSRSWYSFTDLRSLFTTGPQCMHNRYVYKLTQLKTKIVGAFAFQMQARVARSTTTTMFYISRHL